MFARCRDESQKSGFRFNPKYPPRVWILCIPDPSKEARAEKGIAQHIDASSVVWTFIDNGKIANQIARLAAIVVKYSVPTVYFAVTISHVLGLS